MPIFFFVNWQWQWQDPGEYHGSLNNTSENENHKKGWLAVWKASGDKRYFSLQSWSFNLLPQQQTAQMSKPSSNINCENTMKYLHFANILVSILNLQNNSETTISTRLLLQSSSCIGQKMLLSLSNLLYLLKTNCWPQMAKTCFGYKMRS